MTEGDRCDAPCGCLERVSTGLERCRGGCEVETTRVEQTGRARRRTSRSATERVDSIQTGVVADLDGRLRLHGGQEHGVEL